MSENQPYSVAIRWTGDKQGTLFSVDELAELQVAAPPQFGGPPGVWSPEHLFVASVVSCYLTTFLAIAKNSNYDFLGFECDAEGILEQDEDRRYQISEIILRPCLELPQGANPERAERILQKAENACLISRSIRSRVRLQPRIDLRSAVA